MNNRVSPYVYIPLLKSTIEMSIWNTAQSILRQQGILSFTFRVVRYLVAYTMIPLYFITQILAGWLRQDEIWVIAGGAGREFAGNSKYFYLQLANSASDERPIWITASKEVKRELNTNGYEAYLASETRGIYYSFRAGQVVTSNTLPIWTFGFSGGATTIQLWHGSPLKRLPTKDRGFNPWDLKRTLQTYDYLVTNSEGEQEAFNDILDFETVLPAGYPRNDQFYREIDGATIGVPGEAQSQIVAIEDEQKVIGYFPTWRGFDSDIPINFEELDAELDVLGAHLVVKAHRNQNFETPNRPLEHINFLPTVGDPYPLFDDIDIMVTDYSSIYFDYLHLDRPVVFYTYDFDDYTRERGFYFDFESITPGPNVHSFDELVGALHETCSTDEYADERAAVRKKVFIYQDGNASQRIINSVVSDNDQ